ncbi:MAG: 5'/3'-nucleotidase SurE [Erysipelotrichaceae bacterium]|nr:5'/3'-nucleotidase SurE [Erysipelotrichaceae bacterium]
MNVLICNDDGIDSIGLKKLCEEFAKVADVYVVAPEGERSSYSHHLTIVGKVRYEERTLPYTKKAFALWGSPADCAYLGMNILIDEKIDLVVSGINEGCNVSTDIVYSGTIAAARQAYIEGVPSLALSLNNVVNGYYENAAYYGRVIAEEYLKREDRHEFFLNINVPDLKLEEIKGIKICDHEAMLYYDNNLSLEKEDGIDYVKINECVITTDSDPEDMAEDFAAVNAGYVTVSPIYNDHFHHEKVKALKEWLEK